MVTVITTQTTTQALSANTDYILPESSLVTSSSVTSALSFSNASNVNLLINGTVFGGVDGVHDNFDPSRSNNAVIVGRTVSVSGSTNGINRLNCYQLRRGLGVRERWHPDPRR